MIELMVVIALATILLTMAAPSFTGMIGRNKIEGLMGELSSDLAYARSEAIAGNATVGLQVASSCYAIFKASDPPAGTCDCTASTVCTGGPTLVKTVSFSAAGVDATPASVTTFAFESVRGSVEDSNERTITLESATTAAKLRARVLPVGRVSVCSPSGNFTGYPSC